MTIFCLLVGAIIGSLGAWYLAGLHLQRKFLVERSDAQARVAVADSTIAALHSQNQELNSKLESNQQRLDDERQARVSAETRLAEAMKSMEEQRRILAEAEQKLINTFKALSDDALKSNNQAFLHLAKQSLETIVTEAKGDLGQRQQAISGLVKPLEDVLKRYEQQVTGLEKDRQNAYTELRVQISSLAETEQRLQKETENLISALRLPQVRGRWGEITLKRVVELSGMSEHCDFVEQPSIESEEGRLRPDLVVHLPANRQVVVDAKTPLDAYLDAIEAPDEEKRDSALRRHAEQLRTHMIKLSSKNYWSQFPEAPEFVVLFIPGESFFSAALKFDRTLIEDGIANRVVLATPTTLIALLRAVAYGWRQEQIAKNAQEIAELGRQIYKRFQAFLDHVNKTRTDLEQSVFSFNRMIGSLEGRILPGLRKFRELGATGGDEIPIIEPIEQTPRELSVQNESVEANESE
ncbi:MAG: DNA recombination protein RmuC [Candidatus Omnitrophica bacterium]|nr:DNA recombination protein RmuC [Candidatus Omnitrophota bacterium]